MFYPLFIRDLIDLALSILTRFQRGKEQGLISDRVDPFTNLLSSYIRAWEAKDRERLLAIARQLDEEQHRLKDAGISIPLTPQNGWYEETVKKIEVDSIGNLREE